MLKVVDTEAAHYEVDGRSLLFTSRILPPYMRRSPKVAEVLPVQEGKASKMKARAA